MTFKDRIRGLFGRRVKPSTMQRAYDAGKVGRLTADWLPSTYTGDSEIRYDIVTLRDRSRQQEHSNEWVARALQVFEDNVLNDEDGFALKNKATRPPDFKVPDLVANAKIEQSWAEWCQNCTEEGEDGMADVLSLCLRSAARDGGLLIKDVYRTKTDEVNKWGYALKLCEIDYLDTNYNTILPNGNYVIMGVEKNRKGQRVNYHLLEGHPGDLLFGGPSRYNRIVTPASSVIHYFAKERTTQTIGVPWFAPSMVRLKHLREYEIAEMIAAREASEKGGFWTNERGQPYAGDPEFGAGATGTEQTGTYSDSEPGMKDEMPAGWQFTAYDPTHPTDAFGDFVTSALLGAAAGMGISYMTLTGDLSKANYSSLRSGQLGEQRAFRKIQKHMIRKILMPIFTKWLEASILSGAINLPMSKFALFNKPSFTGCRWGWVDPEKDVRAALMEIDAGLSTRAKWIEERDGGDLEETFTDLSAEQDLAEKYNLEFATPSKPLQPEPVEEPAVDGDRNGRAKNLLTH